MSGEGGTRTTRLTPRQRRAMDALAFLGGWVTVAEVFGFVRDNGPAEMVAGRRPMIGWENTLRSLEDRGLIEGRAFPSRYRAVSDA